MFVIIGILVVLGAVIGGFLMEHGPIRVLMQPSEAIIICGAALGTLLVANPLHTLKAVMSGVLQVLKGSKFTKKRYLDSLKMLYDMFNKIRREGPNSVENDIEAPDKSQFFGSYPAFVKDHHVRDFVCDTMRVVLMGGVQPFDLDQMIEADMEVHAHQTEQSVTALSTVADSLPGLGIVAAVLGVVMTMSALGGPPEEIGKKVAAALVGTFLGILMCYGFIGPISSNLAKLAHEEHEYLHVLRVSMTAFMKGTAPLLATEMGRRAIPAHLRPSFAEFETNCKQTGAAAPAGAEGEAAGEAAAEPAAEPAAEAAPASS
jgi:chemotaxis protein MotA